MHDNEGKFMKGFLFSTTLSIPIWLSLFGWVKIIFILIDRPYLYIVSAMRSNSTFY